MDATKAYTVEEANDLVKKVDFAKFDASLEAYYRFQTLILNKLDQQIRAVVLPNGTGKTQRVIVFAQGEQANKLKLLVLT